MHILLHPRKLWQFLCDPRVLQTLCLWAMIAAAGVYLAHTVAMGV